MNDTSTAYRPRANRMLTSTATRPLRGLSPGHTGHGWLPARKLATKTALAQVQDDGEGDRDGDEEQLVIPGLEASHSVRRCPGRDHPESAYFRGGGVRFLAAYFEPSRPGRMTSLIGPSGATGSSPYVFR